METNSVQAELGGAVCQYGVPEDRSRLLLLESAGAREQIQEAVAALRLDRVVLLRNVDPADADARIAEIAASLQLYDYTTNWSYKRDVPRSLDIGKISERII